MKKQRIGTMRAMQSTWRRIIVPLSQQCVFSWCFKSSYIKLQTENNPNFSWTIIPSYYQMCIYIPQIPPNLLKVGPFSEMGCDSLMLFSHKIWTNEVHAALVFTLLFQIHHTRCGLSQHRDPLIISDDPPAIKFSKSWSQDTQHLTETTFVKRQTNKDLSCESATGYIP